MRYRAAKIFQQPDGLQVAPTLPRQASGTVDPVEVADGVELEQGRRVERWLARGQDGQLALTNPRAARPSVST